MGTLIIADNRKIRIKTVRRTGNRLLKFIMLLFVLVSMTLLTSCFIGPPHRMGDDRHAEYREHHDDGNRGHHGEGHHDNGEHHDRD
jgi:hypothetical protein